jgi:uncharacterized protein
MGTLGVHDHTPTPAQAFERARRQHQRDRLRMADLDRRAVTTPAARRLTNPGYLDGLAVVYNSVTVLHEGGVTLRELVRPDSMRLPPGGRDVVSRFNHDPNQHLGRMASGSLVLTDTPQGVRFRVRLPNTTVGQDVAELVRAGELRGASFTFTVPPGGQDFRRTPDGGLMRTINRFTLYELGPVISPAYLSTTVGHDAGAPRSDDEAEGELAGRVLFTLDWTRARSCPVPAGLRTTEVRYAELHDVRLIEERSA